MKKTLALLLPLCAASFAALARRQAHGKEAGWWCTAMGFSQGEIEKAVVRALFVPLIINLGGNAGSQATSLIIRALTLGEVTLARWWAQCCGARWPIPCCR